MTTLAQFLFDRIAEDEAAAKACISGTVVGLYGHSFHDDGSWVAAEGGDGWYVKQREGQMVAAFEAAYPEGAVGLDEDDAQHISRWDPKRVLLECEARRERLELHKPVAIEFCDLERQHPSEHETRLACSACGVPAEYPVWWPCDTIRTDLAVYADHPDFQPDWRLT